jgi:acyl carrier protein
MERELAGIEARVRSFLGERHPAARRELARLGKHDSLWGVVSSMALLELVDFIEAAFRIEVKPLDYVPDNFGTLACITRFVAGRTGQA